MTDQARATTAFLKEQHHRVIRHLDPNIGGTPPLGDVLWNAHQFDAMVDALATVVWTPHIAAYLEQHDPKALEQARRALGLA